MPFINETQPFNIATFEGIGSALCVSILDIADKNEYSRVYNTPFRTIEMMRYLTAAKISKIKPFKFHKSLNSFMKKIPIYEYKIGNKLKLIKTNQK